MQKINWILLAIATLVMIIIMRESGKTLVTPYTPAGIINLELSRSKTNVRNILNIWSSSNGDKTNNIGVAKNNTYLDFLFIIIYVPFLYFSSLKAVQLFHKRSRMAAIGRQIPWLCLIAGGLDVLENFGMLISLNNHINANTIFFTFSCSLCKWLLLIMVVAYLAFSLPLKLVLQNKPATSARKK